LSDILFLEKGKMERESDTLILEELNPPKNSRIPRRSQEITNGGSWSALTVVLERRRVKTEERGEGVISVQGG
jgi:hypothetical protein